MPSFTEIRAELDAAGLAMSSVDDELAAQTVCRLCGTFGLDGRAFTDPQNGAYRVFGVCPSCHGAEEL